MILLPKVPERADNQWGTLPFVEAGHISHTGISQKEPSSFRTHGKPFIILMLHAERYFGHLSVILHSVWRRTENRSAEIEKSFGAELFTISDHKSLYDKHIPYNLKNERTFPKTLGRDIYCAKVTPNPYVTSHLHTVNADKH